MARFDVQVSVIEPGNYRSEISKTGRARMGGMDAAKENSPCAEDYRRRMEGSTDRSQYKDPDEVADAAMHALFAEQPKRRYIVVPNREEATKSTTVSATTSARNALALVTAELTFSLLRTTPVFCSIFSSRFDVKRATFCGSKSANAFR